MFVNEDIKNKVWQKGLIVEGYNADIFRKDACGAWIIWEKYGLADNPYGWEIDHIYPREKGGGDELDNLRPLNIQNNRSKGDDYPSYSAVITAKGDKNIRLEKSLTVNESTRMKLKAIYNI